MMKSINLANIPPEILFKILLLFDPISISAFSRLSSSYRSFVEDQPQLWKELYLDLFDPPISTEEYDYRKNFKERIRAKRLVQDGNKVESLSEMNVTLLSLINIASTPSLEQEESKNDTFLNELFKEEEAAKLYLLNSSADKDPEFKSLVSIQREELCSRLHLLHTPVDLAMTQEARANARAIVYDRRNFLRRSSFGPFQNSSTGLVDWTKVEALAIVMKCNLLEALSIGWGNENDANLFKLPLGFNSTRPRPQPIGRDWAGVESSLWVGTYSFLDFRTWYSFNSNRRNLINLAEEGEAVGDCMIFSLKLLPEDELGNSPTHNFSEDESDSGDEDYTEGDQSSSSPSLSPLLASPTSETPPIINNFNSDSRIISSGSNNLPSTFSNPLSSKYPTLRFTGKVSNSSSSNLNRTITGSVKMTKDGFVHWEYIIRYGGEDQWCMNGIQIGIGSKSGVNGVWTSNAHEDGSPNGPFWYVPIAKDSL